MRALPVEWAPLPEGNPHMRKQPFKVGDWEVLPLEGRIRRGDEVERLRPKAMDVLCLLAASPGEVIERDTILSEVWGRTAVTDEPLTATVGELRRVLGDRRGQAMFIETIPKRGYRLVATVEALPADGRLGESAALSPLPGPAASHERGRWPMALATFAAVLVLGALAFWRAGEQRAPVELTPPESIAVLPFAMPGASGDELYFGDGLALEVLTTLARIDGLRVAASNSAFAFRDRRGALDEIREALDVDTVLDGTILREGGRVRIQVQLVDARSGYNLWANTYDRQLADAFRLQSDIARAIADQLSVRVLEPGSSSAAGDADAYLEYLRGKYLYETARDEAGLRQAIKHLETAIATSPGFAEARAVLAGVWTRLGDLAFELPDAAYENARKEAQQALSMSPDLAQAYLILGWIRMYYDWDWAGARQYLATALELAPGDAFVISANAALNFHLANFERALALAKMAVERDPLRASSHNNLAYFRYTAGDLDGAEAALERAVELVPGFPGSGMLHVQIDLARGDARSAAGRKETHPLLALLADVLVRHALGDADAAQAALLQLEREYAETGPYQVAEAYAWIGQPDAAFRWLEKAWEVRDPGMADLQVDRLLEPVKQDPRYRELLERVGFTIPMGSLP
ncbi:MAG: winged helix-turn-helix domain-containing protein [Woeseiaceae bacterium]|jgi:TolB-like protein/DNA-binding winged helix-turn-helix (wHTH) protein/Tfp pilus assembly protein PilF|nr:winged helix-turn-helix domain-containing protein [Woeseiaceae bacterium]